MVVIVSYCNHFFFIIRSSRIDCLFPVKFKRFSESNSQAFQQLFLRSFLTIDTRDFFDPADPPVSISSYYRVVCWPHFECLLLHPSFDSTALHLSSVKSCSE